MPYQSHPVFTPPSDPKTKLWRYLDFPKFVALLQRRALWFSAAHLLGDSFEGSYTLASTERRRHLLPDESESYTQIMGSLEARYNQGTRNWTYINCWHMGDQESAAMWEIYAGRGKGIAIRSSFERLTDSLESQDPTYVGMVRYIDYSSDWIPTNNLFWPFLHKRKSFEHERELRAIIHRSPNPPEFREHLYERPPPDEGLSVPTNLESLIDAVKVAPSSPGWFLEVVVEVAKVYGLKVQPEQSELDVPAVF